MRLLLLTLLSIVLPPLAVGIVMGWNKHLIINLILMILGVVPAMVHAIQIVFKNTK